MLPLLFAPGRRMMTDALVVPSRHLAMYRGTCLLVCERGEAFDCVGAQKLAEVLELSRGHLPIGVVGDAGEIVRPNARGFSYALRSYFDVVN